MLGQIADLQVEKKKDIFFFINSSVKELKNMGEPPAQKKKKEDNNVWNGKWKVGTSGDAVHGRELKKPFEF